MKKLLILLLLLSPMIASAYQVKYYHPAINQTEINNTINSIPTERFDGVKAIRFYHCLGQIWAGKFIVGGIIYVDVCYDGVYKILQHELQHNCCWNKERYLGHVGCFNG